MPYRRSIYIGIGGLGIQTISKVKDCYNRVINLVEPIIKFVGIDTDVQNLRNSSLNRNECIALQSRNAMDRIHAHPDGYTWLPDENRHYLQSLTNHGTGQVRSNGRFLFENNKDEILRHLLRCYQEITQVDPGIADVMFVPNIDIHIVSSIAGGTGSGIIIQLAKQVREIIPNSNIIGYFFSHSFYQHLGVHWNIKPNAYATLFELNCEMSSQNKPFDVCLYVDNRTDDHNNILMPYVVDLDYAINAVANTMYIVSSFGNGFCEYYDDIKAAMACGAFDKGIRKSWLAGIGSCTLSYNEDEIYNYIYHVLASRFVHSLLYNDSTLNSIDNDLYGKVCESYDTIKELSNDIALPSMVDIGDDGSIHDEQLQVMRNDYFLLDKQEIVVWGDNIRTTISSFINSMLLSCSIGLINTAQVISELIKIVDTLIDRNDNEREFLQNDINQAYSLLDYNSHQLQVLLNSNFYSRLIHRTEIEQLKESVRLSKSQLFNKERAIAFRHNIKEVLSTIHRYCTEMVQQINRLIHNAKSVSEEIDSFIYDCNTKRVSYNEIGIDVTSEVIHQLDSLIINAIVNEDIVRNNLLQDGLTSIISKNGLIELISHNCADININFNTLLANSEYFNRYLIDICRRSNVLLNLDFKGENILQAESVVIATPHVLVPIVQNIMVNQIGINQFQIIHEESNEIRIFRKSYLYSPHYIRDAWINLNDFNQVIREQRYSPFTDKKYIEEYKMKGGF